MLHVLLGLPHEWTISSQDLDVVLSHQCRECAFDLKCQRGAVQHTAGTWLISPASSYYRHRTSLTRATRMNPRGWMQRWICQWWPQSLRSGSVLGLMRMCSLPPGCTCRSVICSEMGCLHSIGSIPSFNIEQHANVSIGSYPDRNWASVMQWHFLQWKQLFYFSVLVVRSQCGWFCPGPECT